MDLYLPLSERLPSRGLESCKIHYTLQWYYIPYFYLILLYMAAHIISMSIKFALLNSFAQTFCAPYKVVSSLRSYNECISKTEMDYNTPFYYDEILSDY
ncbi:hypothetical protein PROFUN_15794 [Planoprotostelium fungivorum]|uniref:Uncharacterized protein n=1 Tax=Planoprotostelium fungivorum TaxID=1890364 RepID=A0A2P6MUD7_9EUKA|nr:hypothetical protein PROFUN_15794 [Planoprotostelium fungivorum]